MRGYRSIISMIKSFYQSLYWISDPVEFHHAIFAGNENLQRWRKMDSLQKIAPAITQKTSAEGKESGINWSNQAAETKRRELKTHRVPCYVFALFIHRIAYATYATYIRPPACLSDSAYRLIERVVLRRGCRLLVVPLD